MIIILSLRLKQYFFRKWRIKLTYSDKLITWIYAKLLFKRLFVSETQKGSLTIFLTFFLLSWVPLSFFAWLKAGFFVKSLRIKAKFCIPSLCSTLTEGPQWKWFNSTVLYNTCYVTSSILLKILYLFKWLFVTEHFTFYRYKRNIRYYWWHILSRKINNRRQQRTY